MFPNTWRELVFSGEEKILTTISLYDGFKAKEPNFTSGNLAKEKIETWFAQPISNSTTHRSNFDRHSFPASIAFLFLRFTFFVVSQVRRSGRERESFVVPVGKGVRARGSELSMSTRLTGSNSFFLHPPPSPITTARPSAAFFGGSFSKIPAVDLRIKRSLLNTAKREVSKKGMRMSKILQGSL